MRIDKRGVIVGVIVVALCLAREPLFRPNQDMVKSWLNGTTIMLERGDDSEHFVFDRVESSKIQKLKHVDGTIYRTSFWTAPSSAVAVYSFMYPCKGSLQTYRANLRYSWSVRFLGVKRERISAGVVGPLDKTEQAR